MVSKIEVSNPGVNLLCQAGRATHTHWHRTHSHNSAFQPLRSGSPRLGHAALCPLDSRWNERERGGEEVHLKEDQKMRGHSLVEAALLSTGRETAAGSVRHVPAYRPLFSFSHRFTSLQHYTCISLFSSSPSYILLSVNAAKKKKTNTNHHNNNSINPSSLFVVLFDLSVSALEGKEELKRDSSENRRKKEKEKRDRKINLLDYYTFVIIIILVRRVGRQEPHRFCASPFICIWRRLCPFIVRCTHFFLDMSSMYQPGDRVWVLNEGSQWWPGRILSDEQLEEMGVLRQSGADLTVFLYSEEKDVASSVLHMSSRRTGNICFFEASSEKAVTSDPILKAAIANAISDETANPLQSDSAAQQSARVVAGASAAGAFSPPPAAASFKRPREDSFAPGSHRSTSHLRQLAAEINDAVESQKLVDVRRALSKLNGVDVGLAQLEDTKIGVAIGSILGVESLRPVWPLAKAIISFWARHLPEETIRAIRVIRQMEEGGDEAKRAGPMGQWTLGSPAGGGVASPTRPCLLLSLRSPRGFRENVYEALDNPVGSERLPADVLERVSAELEQGIKDPDARQLLLVRLRNPELQQVRDNLLNGKWNAKQYLSMPDSVFVTTEELEQERQRAVDALSAVEQAQLATTNVTNLFLCENCGKRNCRYYEQQTRGADEPTTKFITCLDCNVTGRLVEQEVVETSSFSLFFSFFFFSFLHSPLLLLSAIYLFFAQRDATVSYNVRECGGSVQTVQFVSYLVSKVNCCIFRVHSLSFDRFLLIGMSCVSASIFHSLLHTVESKSSLSRPRHMESLDVGSYVWIHQEGYPWWPGIVLDPSQAGHAIPDELGSSGICVMCFPTASASLAFVRRDNPAEVLPFRPGSGPEEEDRVAAAKEHPDCAAALEEALQAHATSLDGPTSKQRADAAAAEEEDLLLLNLGSGDDDDDDAELKPVPGDSTSRGEGHRRDKKEKKEKRDKKKEKEGKDSSRKRRRSRSGSGVHSSDDAVGKDELQLLLDDEAEAQRLQARRLKKAERRIRQSEAARQRRSPSLGGEAAEDPFYEEESERHEDYKERLRAKRHPATDAELQRHVDIIKQCLLEERESGDFAAETVMASLRHLAPCDVTLDQLKRLEVGRQVGYLLRDTCPPRIRLLARSILSYWFSHLDSHVQESLMVSDEVRGCSEVTTLGDQSEDRGLGGEALNNMSTLCAQIYSYFTEEETLQADVDEAGLLKVTNPDNRMSILHRVASEAPLRLALLAEDQSAEDLVTREEQAAMGLASPVTFFRGGSPGSPFTQGTPNTFGPSTQTQSDVPTAMHPCPTCGATDAYRSMYTVSAHDNFPDILRCRHCNTTWNIAE
eukprot:gene10597-7361_t